MKIDKQKELEITDIMTAAFLLAKKYPLISHHVGATGFVSFRFQDKNNSIEQDIHDHLSGKAKVVSSDFVEAYRGLRSIILRAREEKRNEKNNRTGEAGFIRRY
jgi:hypothetical protein